MGCCFSLHISYFTTLPRSSSKSVHSTTFRALVFLEHKRYVIARLLLPARKNSNVKCMCKASQQTEFYFRVSLTFTEWNISMFYPQKKVSQRFYYCLRKHYLTQCMSQLFLFFQTISDLTLYKKLVPRERSFKFERICTRVVPIWLAISSCSSRGSIS